MKCRDFCAGDSVLATMRDGSRLPGVVTRVWDESGLVSCLLVDVEVSGYKYGTYACNMEPDRLQKMRLP